MKLWITVASIVVNLACAVLWIATGGWVLWFVPMAVFGAGCGVASLIYRHRALRPRAGQR